MGRQLISLTPAAVSRFRQILAAQGDGAQAVRLAVKTTGCSGMSYRLLFSMPSRPAISSAA